jgi:hypothetical protein
MSQARPKAQQVAIRHLLPGDLIRHWSNDSVGLCLWNREVSFSDAFGRRSNWYNVGILRWDGRIDEIEVSSEVKLSVP